MIRKTQQPVYHGCRVPESLPGTGNTSGKMKVNLNGDNGPGGYAPWPEMAQEWHAPDTWSFDDSHNNAKL
jgi:hypothetical protein